MDCGIVGLDMHLHRPWKGWMSPLFSINPLVSLRLSCIFLLLPPGLRLYKQFFNFWVAFCCCCFRAGSFLLCVFCIRSLSLYGSLFFLCSRPSRLLVLRSHSGGLFKPPRTLHLLFCSAHCCITSAPLQATWDNTHSNSFIYLWHIAPTSTQLYQSKQ